MPELNQLGFYACVRNGGEILAGTPEVSGGQRTGFPVYVCVRRPASDQVAGCHTPHCNEDRIRKPTIL